MLHNKVDIEFSQDSAHSHYRLTALLKDADALDRVRLGNGDLKPSYLRHTQAHALIPYATALYHASTALRQDDPELMSRVWALAQEV